MPEPNHTPESLKIRARQIRLLERLCNASAISGFEHEVRRIVLEEIRPHTDQIQVDALGNILATVNGSGKRRLRVMLAAHMDEVGMMLSHAEQGNVYRFALVGGVDARTLTGKAVWVGSERVPGVIGISPVHLASEQEKRQMPHIDALRIDLGPEPRQKVRVGDPAVFATPFIRLGGSLRAKALDDRIGVATLIELVKHAPPNIDLLAAFTVQEEVGLRGAGVAAYALNPDLAIILDSTPARDLPSWNGAANEHYNTRLDHGPALYIADRATLSDPRLVRHLVQTAQASGIPFQFRQPGGGGTDAGAIHQQRGGIPSVSVSVPARYLHTPAAIARLADWQHTLTLVHQALHSLTPEVLSGERAGLDLPGDQDSPARQRSSKEKR